VVVRDGAAYDGARVVQSDQLWGHDQWRVVLDGTTHKLINQRSGKCLDLDWNSNQIMNMVQRTCSTSFTQRFTFTDVMPDGYLSIRTGHQQALRIEGSSANNNTAVVQEPFDMALWNQHFTFEPVGYGSHVAIDQMARAVYAISARHSGKAMMVDGGSSADGAAIRARSLNGNDDTFQWYLSPRGNRYYQLMNRRSGKCLDLANVGSASSALVQRRCTTSDSQKFHVQDTGDGYQVLYSKHWNAIGVQGAATYDGAPMSQGDQLWSHHQQLRLEPLMAGEPHELRYSHVTADGPCGDYYWYDISQPNGLPLDSPAGSFVQLIFAGGKTSRGGRDQNPFIAQQVAGNKVAIDPSGYMNGGSRGASGSCVASDLLYDATRRAAGSCCIRYNGRYGSFRQSFWSSTTFLCQ
jgi:hypothetical protein